MFPDLPTITATGGISEPDRIEREYFTRAWASKVGDGTLNVEHEY